MASGEIEGGSGVNWASKVTLALLLLLTTAQTVNATCSLPTSDRWLVGAFYAMSIADIVSTRKALDEGAIELNPVIGRNPTNERLAASALISGVVITLGACTLGDTDRRKMLWTMIALKIALVHRNQTITASMRF